MSHTPRVPAYKSALVAATLAFVGTISACSVDNAPESISSAISSAKTKAEELQQEGNKLLTEAKSFSSKAKQSIEDATSTATNSANEARAALEKLQDKKDDAAAEATAARTKLEEAKTKLTDLAGTLSGDELKKVEAERDKIMGTLDSLIAQLETTGK